MNHPYLLALSVLTFLSFSACSKKDADPDPASGTLEIYAAGMQGSKATYWKNDSAVIIGGGTFSQINGVLQSGRDVYAAGMEHGAAGDRAMFWKNGLATPLSDGLLPAEANDIAVQGSDVYVVGLVTNSGGTLDATCWKNGVASKLGTATDYSVATGVVVFGGDVFAIGWERGSGGRDHHCFWKNGQRFYLGDTSALADARSITVSGDNIYMAWSDEKNIYYAKNFGAPVLAGRGWMSNSGHAITVQGTDVYIAGWDWVPGTSAVQPKYWKNGAEVPLAIKTGEFAATSSVAIDGSDVYVGGTISNNIGHSNAVYWKNGTQVRLSDSIRGGAIRQMILKRW